MTEDQARLNADSLSRTLRVGRQMMAFTDALFAGKSVADPFADDTKSAHPQQEPPHASHE
jgi:hypothetical protein